MEKTPGHTFLTRAPKRGRPHPPVAPWGATSLVWRPLSCPPPPTSWAPRGSWIPPCWARCRGCRPAWNAASQCLQHTRGKTETKITSVKKRKYKPQSISKSSETNIIRLVVNTNWKVVCKEYEENYKNVRYSFFWQNCCLPSKGAPPQILTFMYFLQRPE